MNNLMNHRAQSTFTTSQIYDSLRGPTSSSCGGLWPSAKAFLATWVKTEPFYAFFCVFSRHIDKIFRKKRRTNFFLTKSERNHKNQKNKENVNKKR